MTWVLPESERVPSPNCYDARVVTVPVDLLVLHYAVDAEQRTEDAADVARGFSRPKRGASAHFVVGRDGSRRQCVPLDKPAWHAGDGGKSRFPQVPPATLAETPKRSKQVNLRSVGIELCNVGWAVDRLGVPEADIVRAQHRNPASSSQRWERFTHAQMNTLELLVAMTVSHVPTMRWVCGHEDVTNQHTLGRPGAKLDPGPAFDWSAIHWARYGLTRVVYDFASKTWVLAEDAVTQPIEVSR
jgi:N-acetylmuramoyl-L-alanine amidase